MVSRLPISQRDGKDIESQVDHKGGNFVIAETPSSNGLLGVIFGPMSQHFIIGPYYIISAEVRIKVNSRQ